MNLHLISGTQLGSERILSMENKDEFSDCPNGKSQCPIYDDIAELKAQVASLNDRVRTDFLTGLYNRQQLLISLEQELERTARSHQATCLIMLDVDHFKSINDTHGHIAGDHVLKQLAKIINETIRKIDVACRFGGEEFAIVLPSSASLTGVQVAERLRKVVEETPFTIDKTETINITISLGVHSYLHTYNYPVEEFIKRTDEQLYLAKKQGRNKVVHFTPSKSETAVVSSEEKDALFDALNKKD